MKRVVATAFPTDPYLDSPITLGAAIRAARTQAGLRQEDAALSIGKILQVAHSLGVSLLVIPQAQRDATRRYVSDLSQRTS